MRSLEKIDKSPPRSLSDTQAGDPVPPRLPCSWPVLRPGILRSLRRARSPGRAGVGRRFLKCGRALSDSAQDQVLSGCRERHVPTQKQGLCKLGCRPPAPFPSLGSGVPRALGRSTNQSRQIARRPKLPLLIQGTNSSVRRALGASRTTQSPLPPHAWEFKAKSNSWLCPPFCPLAFWTLATKTLQNESGLETRWGGVCRPQDKSPIRWSTSHPG